MVTPARFPTIGTLALALILAATPLAAQPDADEVPPSPPREALLFKSGHAWVERAVTLDGGPAREARIVLPRSIFGTVWLETSPERLQSATARMARRPEPGAELADLAGLLRVALGRRVTLELSAGDQPEFVTGTVARLFESPHQGPRPYETEIFPPFGPQHVALAIDGSVRVIPVHRVTGVTLDRELVGDWRDPRLVEVAVLEVTLEPGAGRGSSEVRLSSLVDGLTWVPSYRLELAGGGRATVHGKAVVVNDLGEDLVDTRVQLVVGYPHIRYAGRPSPLHPLVDFQQLRQLLGSDEDAAMDLSAVMLQSKARAEAAFDAAPPVLPEPAMANEDLYVWDVGRLTLADGERAYLPLSRDEVRARDRWLWEIPDRVQYDRLPYIGGEEPEPPPVWHVIELEHSGKTPWTTAPVLVIGERGPVAQSRLDYTPAGGSTEVELTRAPDLVTEATEFLADEELAQREGTTLFGRHYERVTVTGRLEMTNRSGEERPVRVIKHLSGEVVSSEGDPEIGSETRAVGQVNPTRTLTWNFDLGPGETWKATYRYRVLIQR